MNRRKLQNTFFIDHIVGEMMSDLGHHIIIQDDHCDVHILVHLLILYAESC
jgi:hypothetical protein